MKDLIQKTHIARLVDGTLVSFDAQASTIYAYDNVISDLTGKPAFIFIGIGKVHSYYGHVVDSEDEGFAAFFRYGSEMEDRALDHPERLPHEVYISNVWNNDFSWCGHKTARLGIRAYDSNGNLLRRSRPLFVSATEYMANLVDHGWVTQYPEDLQKVLALMV